MSIGLELHRILEKSRQEQYRREYELWLVERKEWLTSEREKANRAQLTNIDRYMSNMQVRTKRLNVLGEVYYVSQYIANALDFNRIECSYFNYFANVICSRVESHQAFRMIASYLKNTSVKLEMLIGMYLYMFKKRPDIFKKLNQPIDLAQLNVMTNWISTFLGYFVAAGMRATNEHFSLFECLPHEAKQDLISKSTREGKLLNAFCGNDNARAASMLLRTISLTAQTTNMATNFIVESSDPVIRLKQGEMISPIATLKAYVDIDFERSLLRSISYFDNFEFNSDYESLMESYPIWHLTFSTLALLEKTQPDHFDWFVNELESVATGKTKPRPVFEGVVLSNLNASYEYFDKEFFNTEAAMALNVMGVVDMNTFTTRYTELNDSIILTDEDMPVLAGYVQKAVQYNNLGGDLAPFFVLEAK
jgi:hypothetical protein